MFTPALTVSRLEPRDVPAAFVAGAYDPSFEPIPGWRGPVAVANGDFDGNGSEDVVYAAGPDGAPRVRVYSGGRLNEPPVPSPVPGVMMPPGLDAVLFDDFVFEPGFYGGADVNVIVRPGEADLLVFSPGVGGGPRLRFMTIDRAVDRSVLAFDDPDYRGGLNVQSTTVDFRDPAGEHPFGVHLVVTPKAGGGPVLAAYDAAGDKLVQFAIGPLADRREYRVIASDVAVPGHPGRRGTYVEGPDGDVTAYDWFGVPYVDAADPTPAAAR